MNVDISSPRYQGIFCTIAGICLPKKQQNVSTYQNQYLLPGMIQLTRTTRQTGADQVLLNELNASRWRFQLGISCQSQLTGQGLEKQFNVKMCEYLKKARKKDKKQWSYRVFQDPHIPRNEGVWLMFFLSI